MGEKLRVEKVDDIVPLNHVLVSVSDKTGLDNLVTQLVDIRPEIRFYSTGGTYSKIKEVLGDKAGNNLVSVESYTGFPEMEGGLVKTLHPNVHAAILGDTNNPKHVEYLKNLSKTVSFIEGDPQRVFDAERGETYKVQILEGVPVVFFDLAVVNLYPFRETVANKDNNFEDARQNIDIGGPAMIRAAAKNLVRVGTVCDPKDYADHIISEVGSAGGLTLRTRVGLAQKAFWHTAMYDLEISRFLKGSELDPIMPKINKCYKITPAGE